MTKDCNSCIPTFYIPTYITFYTDFLYTDLYLTDFLYRFFIYRPVFNRLFIPIYTDQVFYIPTCFIYRLFIPIFIYTDLYLTDFLYHLANTLRDDPAGLAGKDQIAVFTSGK